VDKTTRELMSCIAILCEDLEQELDGTHEPETCRSDIESARRLLDRIQQAAPRGVLAYQK
jgi:hypothetical protein